MYFEKLCLIYVLIIKYFIKNIPKHRVACPALNHPEILYCEMIASSYFTFAVIQIYTVISRGWFSAVAASKTDT